MMRSCMPYIAIRNVHLLLMNISQNAQQHTHVQGMDALQVRNMMLVSAILNVIITTSELPTFVGDIAAISYTDMGLYCYQWFPAHACSKPSYDRGAGVLPYQPWTSGAGCNGFGVDNTGGCPKYDISDYLPYGYNC